MSATLTAPETTTVGTGSNLDRVCEYLLSDLGIKPGLARVFRPVEEAQTNARPTQAPRTCVIASAPGVPFRSFLALNIAVEAARRSLKTVLIDRSKKLLRGEFAPELFTPGKSERYLGHYGLRLVIPTNGEDLPSDHFDADLFLVHAPSSPVEERLRTAGLGDALVLPIGPAPVDAAKICAFLNAMSRLGPVPMTYLVVVGAAGVREARETFTRAARAIRAVSAIRVQSAGFVILDPALRNTLANGKPLHIAAPYAASTRSIQGVARLVIGDVLARENRIPETWDA